MKYFKNIVIKNSLMLVFLVYWIICRNFKFDYYSSNYKILFKTFGLNSNIAFFIYLRLSHKS